MQLHHKMKYYLQTLSPVHVGSGEKLRNGLDFFSAKDRTWLVDQGKFEKILEKNSQAFTDFVSQEEPDVHLLSHEYKLNMANFVTRSYAGMAEAGELHEFMRTGKGIPFIPGSSIKGALRTVLFWKLSQSPDWQKDAPFLLEKILQARSERTAGHAMVEKAFNIAAGRKRPNDANRDLSRVLRVGDVHFDLSDLQLADCRIFNVVNEHRGGWKNLRQRRNFDQPRMATSIAVEALLKSASAEVEITLDNFLLESREAQNEARFGEYRDELFAQLPALCNEYAARQIAKQRDFFEKYQLGALVSFYDALEQARQNLENGEFLLRLSWGSGWQSMTGEVIESPDDLQKVRKRFDLGKSQYVGEFPDECPICGSNRVRPDKREPGTGFCFEGRHSFPAEGFKKVMFPVFPKTRKIALTGGRPGLPFGWVCFRKARPESPFKEEKVFVAPQYTFKQDADGPGKKSKEADKIMHKKQREEAAKKLKPSIQVRTKIRAEVTKAEGMKFHVCLLEKDTGRELSFTRAYLPVKAGDTVEVRVLATNKAGDEVTKIEFVKKISK